MKAKKEYPISIHDNPLYKISYLLRYDTNFPTMITIIKRVTNQGFDHDQVMDIFISDLQQMGNVSHAIEVCYKCGFWVHCQSEILDTCMKLDNDKSETTECDTCNGTGVDFSFTFNPLDMPTGKGCPTCHGIGKIELQPEVK